MGGTQLFFKFKSLQRTGGLCFAVKLVSGHHEAGKLEAKHTPVGSEMCSDVTFFCCCNNNALRRLAEARGRCRIRNESCEKA